MTCAQCQELLLDLIYGELEPARAAEVELHLAGCADCRAERAKLDGTRAAFAPLFAEAAPGAAAASGLDSPGPAFDGPILAAAREAAAQARLPAVAAARPPAEVIPLATRAASTPAQPRGKVGPRWMRATLIASVAAAAALAVIVTTGRKSSFDAPPTSAEEAANTVSPTALKAPAAPAPALLQPVEAPPAAPAARLDQPAAEGGVVGGVVAQEQVREEQERSRLAQDKPSAHAAAEEPQPKPAERVFAPPPPAEIAKKSKAARRAVDGDAEPAADPGFAEGAGAGGALAGLSSSGASGGAGKGGPATLGLSGAGAGFAPPPPPPKARAPADDDGATPERKARDVALAAPAAVSSARLPAPSQAPAPAAPSPVAAKSDSAPAKEEVRAAPVTVASGPPDAMERTISSAGRAQELSAASLEESAAATRDQGDLDRAARLYLLAARKHRGAGEPAEAARDLSRAVACFAAAGRLSEARAARDELAALSPAQESALSEADEAISGRSGAHAVRAKQSAPAAAPATAAPSAKPPAAARPAAADEAAAPPPSR